jgi:hypothetical protein
MSRTQITFVEVVLLRWQKLPDEFLSLSANWTFTESRFYKIAQADMVSALTVEMLGLFEQVKKSRTISPIFAAV